MSTRDVFKRLGISVQEINLAQADAFEKLKSGEIAAGALIAGKPSPSMERLGAADGFRLLPVPFAKPLQADYLPAVLDHDDYPGLVGSGHDIDTVAVSAVMIAYIWPIDSDRYRRIANFVDVFFSEVGRAAEAAAPSEVARDQPGCGAAGLDPVSRRGRLAQQASPAGARG